MKIKNWCRNVASTLVAAGIWMPAASYAINIPLGDPSFEVYVVPASGFAYAAGPLGAYRPTSPWVDDLDNPPGFTQDDAVSNWIYNAAYAETTMYTKRGAPRSGTQAMHGLNAYTAQETSAVFAANATYTFSIWAQNDVDLNETNGVFLYIFDGTVPFGDANALEGQLFTAINARGAAMTPAQSQANWTQLSVNHTVAPGAPEIGHPVGVGFFARKDSAVDDANLTYIANAKFWDVDGATPGGSSLTTASGNWSTSAANWSTSANGDVATQAWSNAVGYTAVFSAGTDVMGTSTITVVGTQTVSGITVEEGTITITGADINLNSGSAIDVSSSTLTVASALAGSGFDKTGSGVLRLDGDNTYSGATTISQGTLQLRAAERIPDGSALTIASGATLDFDIGEFNFEAVGSLSGDGNVQLVSGALEVGYDNSSTTFSGAISGTASGFLYKTGSGIFTLSGISSHSNVGVGGGVLSGNTIGNIGVPSAFGTGVAAESIFIEYGGTLEYTGPNASTNRPLFLQVDGGAISVSNSATTLIWDGEISLEGNLTKSGAGTLQLNANNTYLGNTIIAQGTLRLGDDDRIPDGSALTIASGATFDLGDNNYEAVGSLSGAGNVQLGVGILDVGYDNSSTTFSGAISGSVDGWLYKSGSGTLTLSGINSHPGLVGVGEGVLSGSTIGNIGVPSAFGTGVYDHSFLIEYGGTLEYTGPNASTNRPVNLQAVDGAISVSNAATTLIWDGVIYEFGNLTKTGAGTLQLNAVNTYEGSTTIAQGTLSGNSIADAGVNSAFGQGNFAISNGAMLEYTGETASTDRSVSLGTGGGAINVSNSGTNLTLNGVIDGSGGLTKHGPGTLQLDADNTYTGNTTISQGILRLGAPERIPNGSALTIASGATFDIGDNYESIGSLSGDGNLQLGGDGGLEVGYDNSSTTFSGTISGPDSAYLSKFGSGTLTLSGINSISGEIAVSEGGTLSGNTIANIGVPSAFGTGAGVAGPSFVIEYGGTLEYTGPNASTNRSMLLGEDGGTISVSNSETTLIWDGVIHEFVVGNLTKSGAGNLQLNAANTYEGATTIAQGTLQIGASERIPDGSAVTIVGDAVLFLNNFDETIGSLASSSTTAEVNLGDGVLTTGGDNSSTTFAGSIGGLLGSLTKVGAGTLTLSGTAANTYTGTTTVSQGILRLVTDERIPDGSAVTVASGATFDLNVFNGFGNEAVETIGSLAGDGSVMLGFQTLITGGDNSSTTFSGAISGTIQAVLYKIGSGAFTLSGINSNSDAVGVAEGVLSGNTIGNIGVPSAFGTGATDHRFLLDGGTLEYTGPNASTNRHVFLDPGGALSVANSGTTLILDGVIGGVGEFTKSGSGTLTLTGDNNYTGATTITQGTLRLGASDRLPDGTAVTINGSGIFDLNNFNETVGSVAGANSVTLGSGTLTTGGDNASTTFSGVISGTGGLTKQGSGAMTLTGANTYDGLTTINGGALAVNGSITGPVTVNPGGTLAGSGEVVSVTNGGRVAPGNSPGILTIDGDYTQTANGTLEIEVGGPDPGTGHDKVVVTPPGVASLAGDLVVPIINGYQPPVGQEITFLTASTITGGFRSVSAPGLAAANPNAAIRVIEGLDGSLEAFRIKFVNPLVDIQFNSNGNAPEWSEIATWANVVPEEPARVPEIADVIALSNLSGAPQTVVVQQADAVVHRLTMASGAEDTITLGITNGKQFNAVTEAIVGDKAIIELNTGSLVSAAVVVESGGLLAGNGTVKAAQVTVGETLGAAEFSPGLGAGQQVGAFVIDGDYRQAAGGNLEIDVTSNTQFDELNLSGNADLGGALTIDVTGATLTPGATFEVLTAGRLAAGEKFDDVQVVGTEDQYFGVKYLETSPSPGLAPARSGVNLSVYTVGDMNPGVLGLDQSDVDAFALALADKEKYFLQYGLEFGVEADDAGNCDHLFGVDFDDIDEFVALFNGAVTTAQVAQAIRDAQRVPEPSTRLLGLLALGALGAPLLRGRVAVGARF